MVESPEFGAGLAYGLLALTVVGLASLAWRRLTEGRPIPVSGLVAVAAVLLALSRAGRGSTWLLVGVGTVIAGSAVRAWLRTSAPAATLLVAPGAAVIAYQALSGPGWARHVAFVAIATGGALAATYGADHGHQDLGPLLLSISAGGIWATVPDTEHALALLGATAPLALAGWPLRWTRLDAVGAPAWVALAMWTVASEGATRSTAVVGGIGSLGMFALEPTIGALRRHQTRPRITAKVSRLGELGLHLLVVFVSSRVAGLRRSLPLAIVILVVAYSAAAWWLLRRAGGSRASGPHPTPS